MKKRLDQAAFTIVETLFVLSIASLIFLLVFKAVPILIRNGHNNERRQDVTGVLLAVSHWQLNNSGTNFPADPCDAACVTQLLKYTKLTHYDKASVKIVPQAAGGPLITSVPADEIHLYNFYVCHEDNNSLTYTSTPIRATSEAAGYRSVVAMYQIETAGGSGVQCRNL